MWKCFSIYDVIFSLWSLSTACSSTNPLPTPPLAPPPLHPRAGTMFLVVMQHCANSAEEPRPQPLTLRPPLQELVVEVLVFGQNLQVLGKVGRAVVVVNMEERVGRSYGCVVLHRSPHHNWNDTILQGVHKKFLCDVVPAIRVLKGKIELVSLQHLHALTISSWAFQASAAAVDVHLRQILMLNMDVSYLDVFCKLSCVLETVVPCVAV